MKRAIIAVCAGLLVFGGLAAPQAAAAEPKPTVRSEVLAHPLLVKTIHQLEESYRQLEAAPDDFGGNKVEAMGDLRTAIHSLRRALFYRLQMDDDAIDAAQF